MARITREPQRDTKALADAFPYSAEFACPLCGAGWALEPGDAWGLTALDDKVAAVAACPAEGCNGYGVAASGRGEQVALPPETTLAVRGVGRGEVAARRPRPAPQPGGDEDALAAEEESADPELAELGREVGLRYYNPKRPPGLPRSITYEDLHQPRRREDKDWAETGEVR